MEPLLADLSRQVFHEEAQPTPDDIEFLFRLCQSVASVTKDAILPVCDAWCTFVEEKTRLQRLFEAHDHDGSSTIDKCELRGILNEFKDADQLKEVPQEVLDWVFEQSDVNVNGGLTPIEL